ncbi:serine/threonine-protein kinase stk11-like [Brevipalpus obovatus]|uniref:serine/threonine-protein kinase stk11-like n=1 Tax=Brevipalpus obovatus TaxID=246614 RepID=UPI003D9E0FD8
MDSDISLTSESDLESSSISETSFVDDIGEISWQEPIRKKPMIRGKYLRGEFLGQGSFAKVFEALDMTTLQRRAVKIFDLNMIERRFNRDALRSSIEEEIKILRRCDHSNVIQLVDLSRDPETDDDGRKKVRKRIWLFMEYCMSSVTEVMIGNDPHRLPKYQAHKYFLDLFHAVEYLHSRGIYHKDIKTDNMLITKGNVIKLTDLGVAHVTSPYDQSDTCQNAFGTALFQPPEVLKGENSFSASLLDVWSCGVVVYYMMTGEYPFNAESYVELVKSVTEQNFAHNPIVYRDSFLLSFLNQVLEKDSAKRLTLDKIKNHPFLMCRYPEDGPMAKIPPRYSFGDDYRSLTITSYLHQLHYPLDQSDNTMEVNESQIDEFNRRQTVAILRSNRSRPRLKKKRKFQFKRLVKENQKRLLGILGLCQARGKKKEKRREKISKRFKTTRMNWWNFHF